MKGVTRVCVIVWLATPATASPQPGSSPVTYQGSPYQGVQNAPGGFQWQPVRFQHGATGRHEETGSRSPTQGSERRPSTRGTVGSSSNTGAEWYDDRPLSSGSVRTRPTGTDTSAQARAPAAVSDPEWRPDLQAYIQYRNDAWYISQNDGWVQWGSSSTSSASTQAAPSSYGGYSGHSGYSGNGGSRGYGR